MIIILGKRGVIPMIKEQTPAEWLEAEFEYVWARWGVIVPTYSDKSVMSYRVSGMRDHSGQMISIKDSDHVGHIGARVTQTGELWELDNDLEVITL